MTIYVLESHPLMCEAISMLLRKIDPSKKSVQIHTFSKLQEAMLVNGQPEAFIMDPLLIGAKGEVSITHLKTNYPSTPLIIFSGIPREEVEFVCLTAGADIYIEKTASLNDIFSAIRTVLGVSEKLSTKNIKNQMSEGVIKFSKRQKQLLILIDEGLSNDDIAKRLDISPHTVKVHLWRLYKKLEINSRTQLIKFSRDNGYI
jgi:DNA-binding NarL/FixJ family response regulator